MASSSRSCKYDVFLSFRGEDTRKTFVDHLYSNLEQHLIRVYKDDETLPRGESINQSLFEAIEESRIAVIILSKNYADSSWCLDELAHIMKCKTERDLFVIPIFYDVEPTEVRKQKGKFGEAFVKQEVNNVTKAKILKKALVDVSDIAGWEPKNIAGGHESQFIKKIVDTILDRLFSLNSCVDEDLVGMKARFQDLKSLLDVGSGGVRMVGIWGVGGGGKTTLATSLYMEISHHFQGHCIIEDVREETSKYGLNKVQDKILSALLKKKVKVHSVVEGKHKMKNMLCNTKVLVLLDDVDKLDQLAALVGKHNWFGSGSRIIITTRDEHLLRTHKVDHVYPVKLLSHDEAMWLFKRHAYNEEDPVEDYETLSSSVVSYCAGLPLAIKVIGSFLYDKNKIEWMSAMDKLKDISDLEVIEILKISFDGLETYQKELFLDIACFFRWKDTEFAMEILEACGYHPKIGIKVLIQKALITIVDGSFDMHDLVQEMGHYIVTGKHPDNPEKHSRLWKEKQFEDLPYWDETVKFDTIEALILRYGEYDSSIFFKIVSKMKNLRLLIVNVWNNENNEGANFLSNELRYIKWVNYPPTPFPHSFQLVKLVALSMHRSRQKKLWKGYKHLPCLKVLELNDMKQLLSTPNFDGLPRLQKLTLDSCEELEEIHPSLGNHTSLEYFKVYGCTNLKRFPTISQMKNIKTLIISWCYLKDGEIPCGIGELSSLLELNLSGNFFSRLDFSLLQLTRLKSLDLSFCIMLLDLPKLPSSLAILTAHKCQSLTIVEEFNKDGKELRQVTLHKYGWSDRLLQSMLKGKAIENGCMNLHVDGLEIPRRFKPRLHRGSSCRLDLPENWCNDFSGFLICAAFSNTFIGPDVITRISMKQVSGMDFKDDLVWEESDGDKRTWVWEDRHSDKHMRTWVWYVSFGLLRHTTWWDQTYKALQFNFEKFVCIGFGIGVRLVDKKSTSGVTETPTPTPTPTPTHSSSPYAPKFKIIHDSSSELRADLLPYSKTRYRNKNLKMNTRNKNLNLRFAETETETKTAKKSEE